MPYYSDPQAVLPYLFVLSEIIFKFDKRIGFILLEIFFFDKNKIKQKFLLVFVNILAPFFQTIGFQRDIRILKLLPLSFLILLNSVVLKHGLLSLSQTPMNSTVVRVLIQWEMTRLVSAGFLCFAISVNEMKSCSSRVTTVTLFPCTLISGAIPLLLF
jgi:hypothetical protein